VHQVKKQRDGNTVIQETVPTGGQNTLSGRWEHARAAPNRLKLLVDRSLALAAAFCPNKTQLEVFWWNCLHQQAPCPARSLLEAEEGRTALQAEEIRLQMIYMEHEGHQKGRQPRK